MCDLEYLSEAMCPSQPGRSTLAGLAYWEEADGHSEQGVLDAALVRGVA